MIEENKLNIWGGVLMYTNYEYVMTANGELCHYGVPGMKWGKRKTIKQNDQTKRIARGHAGPGHYVSRKRQMVGDKKDLEGLAKGQHLSYGIGKKRQAAFDARDKAAIEKRIAKNETAMSKLNKTSVAKGSKIVQNLLIDPRLKEDIERHNKVGRAPTIQEIRDEANRLGRAPTRQEEIERNRRYNI